MKTIGRRTCVMLLVLMALAALPAFGALPAGNITAGPAFAGEKAGVTLTAAGAQTAAGELVYNDGYTGGEVYYYDIEGTPGSYENGDKITVKAGGIDQTFVYKFNDFYDADWKSLAEWGLGIEDAWAEDYDFDNMWDRIGERFDYCYYLYKVNKDGEPVDEAGNPVTDPAQVQVVAVSQTIRLTAKNDHIETTLNGIKYFVYDGQKTACVIDADAKKVKGALTLPGKVTINGQAYPLTAVETGAFSACTKLTSVKLPASLTSLGDGAFANTGLTRITIPDALEDIGSEAVGFRTAKNAKTGQMVPKKVKGFVVKAKAGTPAEVYAYDNGLKFVAKKSTKKTTAKKTAAKAAAKGQAAETASPEAADTAAAGEASPEAAAEADISRNAADSDAAEADASQDTAIDPKAGKALSYGILDQDSAAFAYEAPAVTVPAEAAESETLPAQYDLREQGRSTSVKDQGKMTFCWAFASLASMESNLLTTKTAGSDVDLSEAHLACFLINSRSDSAASKYAGRDLCFSNMSGATNFYAAGATLARGYGAVNETDMPYASYATGKIDDDFLTEANRTLCRYELQDAIYVNASDAGLPQAYDQAAVDAVKRLIMENGAVASRMAFPEFDDWDKVFGSSKPNQLKTYYSEDPVPDHAITIIGWDDTFDDFATKPAGPGAWIVKDSYGEDLHGDGYFYSSYYSASTAQFVSFTADLPSGRAAYQYDGVGVGDGIMQQAGKVTGSNTYTAREDVLLDQMMTFTPQAGCSVNVKIYVGKNGKKPTAGSKVYDQTFEQKYAGYHRTDLGETIGIPKGAKFSVLVTTKTPDGQYFVPFELENVEDPLNNPAVVQSGQTDVYAGGSWTQVGKATKMKDSYGQTMRLHNALIKVFGQVGGSDPQKITVKTSRKVKKGRTIKLKAKTSGDGKLVYQTANSSKATVSATGVVKAKKKGTVKIRVYASPTETQGSASKVVTVRIR